MSDSKDKSKQSAASSTDMDRRAALRRLGRFAAVTPPSVMLLLAAKTRPANAQERSVTDATTDNAPV